MVKEHYSGIRYDDLDEDLKQKLDTLFQKDNAFIEVNPGNVLLPPKYKEIGDRIYNMEVRPDDVWVVSYPRTGSTWCQEMVWCICNDLNFEEAKSAIGQARNPLLELTSLVEGDWTQFLGHSVEQVENTPPPRFIKTHLPVSLLPKQIHTVKPKIVYITRNPKDMCVSYYHYCKLMHEYNGTLEEFCEIFLEGRAPIGPFWSHVFGFWNMKDEPNVLFLKYEDMKKDHKAIIRKAGKFLGKELTDEQIDMLHDHLSFNNMRSNPTLNLEGVLKLKNGPNFKQEGDQTFIRKGKVGDWKNYMTTEISEKFDHWIEENLKGTGLQFQIS
ncbi:hypothetical protein O3M35_013276 [Rhynocoris fuscipes]|uniref:Sulfotransferase domain-containing protein n=1 Tax=Rhynocoris fuscipes TaxID=488301 RepID=A0AAW1CEJ4_9HEMI